MKKVITIVACLVLLAGSVGWYMVIRPSNIKKSCATKNKDLSNTDTKVTTKNIDRYISDAVPSSYNNDTYSWNDLQDSAQTIYTGAYDRAYNGCLHEHGL